MPVNALHNEKLDRRGRRLDGPVILHCKIILSNVPYLRGAVVAAPYKRRKKSRGKSHGTFIMLQFLLQAFPVLQGFLPQPSLLPSD